MLDDVKQKTTLINLDRGTLRIGKPHPVWSSLQSTISDLQKGIIKARLLTGTYLLQTTKNKYSQGSENAMCKCCRIADEDLEHFLLVCPALYHVRKPLYSELKMTVMSALGPNRWDFTFNKSSDLIRLIIDPSYLAPYVKDPQVILSIHRLSAQLCYRLHAHRIWLHSHDTT